MELHMSPKADRKTSPAVLGHWKVFAFPLLCDDFQQLDNIYRHKVKSGLGKLLRPLCTHVDRWLNTRETETGDIPKRRTQRQDKGHYQHY